MADREKVIKAIEICYSEKHNCTECELFYVEDCNDKLMRDVLELLKAQKSEEPLIIHKDEADEVYSYIAKCPECGMTWAMWHFEKMRHCPGCGRAVKWDEGA